MRNEATARGAPAAMKQNHKATTSDLTVMTRRKRWRPHPAQIRLGEEMVVLDLTVTNSDLAAAAS
jgi:hypothetical protein